MRNKQVSTQYMGNQVYYWYYSVHVFTMQLIALYCIDFFSKLNVQELNNYYWATRCQKYDKCFNQEQFPWTKQRLRFKKKNNLISIELHTWFLLICIQNYMFFPPPLTTVVQSCMRDVVFTICLCSLTCIGERKVWVSDTGNALPRTHQGTAWALVMRAWEATCIPGKKGLLQKITNLQKQIFRGSKREQVIYLKWGREECWGEANVSTSWAIIPPPDLSPITQHLHRFLS